MAADVGPMASIDNGLIQQRIVQEVVHHLYAASFLAWLALRLLRATWRIKLEGCRVMADFSLRHQLVLIGIAIAPSNPPDSKL
jgi:hypothetical protein